MTLTLLTAGCVSPDSGETPVAKTVADFSLDRIDRMIGSGEYLRVIPLILTRQRSGEESPGRYEQALGGLKNEWEDARAESDWRRSLIILRSLKALGEMPFSVTEADLFLEGAAAYLEAGLPGAAAALIFSELEREDIPPERRDRLAAQFENSGHYSMSSWLLSQEPQKQPKMEELTSGTVTVWVNKGIRLVGNVGIPDRVIGSGFFIDRAGYLLTNYHVIDSEVDPSYQGYSRLYIKIDEGSGERIPASVVGWDRNLDLALLKTEMAVPYVHNFSEQNIPGLGTRVSAIGSPGGLSKTLTSGTVSAYARSVLPVAGALQIDVPINPGNSGGPLLNTDGEVIGVIFAGATDYQGINFAIPGSYVKQLVPPMYDGGAVQLTWMGVSGWETAGTVLITYVAPGSPAAAAGLQPGDRIQSIGGQRFSGIRGIQEYLLTRSPGTLMSVRWERGGDLHDGIVSLGTRPDVPLAKALERDAREHLLTPLFGFTVQRISGSGFYQNYRVESVLPGSVADETGFVTGDTFALRRWIHEDNIVAIQLVLKSRKAGFLESAVQLAAYLEVNTVF